jgi:hypothetical protein
MLYPLDPLNQGTLREMFLLLELFLLLTNVLPRSPYLEGNQGPWQLKIFVILVQ